MIAQPSAGLPLRRPLQATFRSDLEIESWSVGATRHTFMPHAHPSNVVALIEDGEVLVTLNQTPFHCRPGAIILITAWTRHTATPIDGRGWAYSSFSIPTSTVHRTADQLKVSPSISLPNGVIYNSGLFKSLQSSQHAGDGQANLRALRQLLSAAGGLAGQSVSRYSAAVASTLEVFHTQFHQPIRLMDVVPKVGLSIFRLIRAFNEELGFTPHEYLMLWRTEQARHFIRRGETLAQTALLCGFYDQPHLNRHFKRVYGLTPAQYAFAVHDATGRTGSISSKKSAPQLPIFTSEQAKTSVSAASA
ncbi:AraC family transcriptional regulator [Deinococcus sp. Arct2-2]|uniref:AraC family transcriptional regulator n=1 Tax=Deinococcus sp. Arct2-2 TaxID=2568653 RepID=UPI0010A48B88|nr:AraC family transcriptional regulator [Deinococcus sp. Arct2-2]THF70928.1 AraC family transcriptional regulator [Deinococcus sp. Arct2-2]